VTEIPPDAGSTENTTFTVDDEDAGELTAVTGSTEEVILAYSADIKNDSSDTCVSNVPAHFEAMVFLEETAAGTVEATFNDSSPCAFTDFYARRAQTQCAIAQNGESVRFKLNAAFNGFHSMAVGLSPVDAPPVDWLPEGTGRHGPASFNLVAGPIESVAGQVTYTAPFFQPWQASAVDTQDKMDTSGDFVRFEVSVGTGVDVVLIDNSQANLFNPYTSPFTGFHFREDIVGSPYFWIGDSFAYNGQTVYPYAATDYFTMTRVGSTDVEFKQNTLVVETVPVTFPTHTNVATFMGRWAWDAGTSDYTLRPFIQNAFIQIGGSDCVRGSFNYYATVPGSVPTTIQFADLNQWAVYFTYFGSSPIDATIFDPNAAASPNTPVFGCDLNTQFEFSLVGGNVVLTVTDWVDYADFMTTKVGNVTTWVYTRPFADTDDFVLQAPYSTYPTGPPVFPFQSMEYAFVNQAANQPLRLATIIQENYDPFTPITGMGLTDVNFTFVPDAGAGPMSYAGQMTQSTLQKAGTEALAPSNFHYKQSFLASAPDNTVITVDDVNDSTHGYKRSS
jgi:hypothetical protein